MNKLTKWMVALSLGWVAWSAVAATTPPLGADRHAKAGVPCAACHGPDMKNWRYPDAKTCTSCHDRKQVAAATATLTPNPHTAPHNNECTLCHYQHEPVVNYCEQCHQFDWKMKGARPLK